jgi:hypothetical protein
MKIDPGQPRMLLLLALGFVVSLLVLQAGTLRAPISGEHNWRQSDTYSVAYNFLHEKAGFFYPRIDWAGKNTGIMGMETPVYTYGSALLMRFVGDSPFAGRLFNWLVLVAGFVSFAICFRPTPQDWPLRSPQRHPNPWWIPIGTITFAILSPLVFFEGRQFQPDPAMAAFTMIAASFFHAFSRRERWSLYALGMLFYCLAVTTKSPALVAGPSLFLLTFTESRQLRWYTLVLRGVPFVLPIALFWAWDQWAHHLNLVYNDGTVYFSTEFNWNDYLARIHDIGFLKRTFWFVIPSYSSNWVLFPVLATGLALGFRRGLRRVSLPMFLWLLLGAGLSAGLERMYWHWYYTFMFMTPLVYFGGIGIAAIFEVMAAYRETTPFVQWGFWFMMIALMATSWAGGPPKHLDQVLGASQPLGNIGWTSEDGFFGLFMLQMVALAMAASMPGRWGERAKLVALAAALYLAIPRAKDDLWQIFSSRSRSAEWGDWKTHWKELREAVDQISTRADRFVVDGGNPWFLHLVLRKGFTFFGPDIDNLGIDYFVDRHIRFYVHFQQNGALPHIFQASKPVRQASRWEIYCIQEGCS